jgi:segregation and condensation protein A
MDIDSGINSEVKEFIPKSRDYLARLTDYQGPLDILLHFVKEDELNIYDIPISKITKDFLDYINFIQSLDIELAGEFLLMASELMKIKARMLIPQIDDEGELIEEDPRLTLVRKLLEYKRFKDASADIVNFETEARKRFFRSYFEKDYKEFETDVTKDFSLKNLTIFNLIKGYRNAISNIRREIVHPIETLDITSETQKDFLIDYFKDTLEVDFYKLIRPMQNNLEMICTFLSILELALEGFLKIQVSENDMSKFSLRKVE